MVVKFLVEKFLVDVFLVEVNLDEEFMFVERVVAELLMWYQSLDFVVQELKSLGQMNQYQTELWQVLVEFVQGFDYEKGSEFHLDLEILMDHTICQILQMFLGLDVLVE